MYKKCLQYGSSKFSEGVCVYLTIIFFIISLLIILPWLLCIQELLDDPSVMVRVVAVAGVCRVLSYYWEMTPAPVIKTLLGRLVKDLAWDASAINVRVAVLQVLV